MEMVYPRVAQTDIDAVFLRQLGASRIVYFPWDVDRVYWEVMCADHGLLLANVIDWATNEARPVTVTGPGLLDVTIWRQATSLTVHLVNLTNAMTMKGPFSELVPSHPQTVKIQLPQGARAERVQLLVSDQQCPVDEAQGFLEVTVPSILDHEVIAVDLENDT